MRRQSKKQPQSDKMSSMLLYLENGIIRNFEGKKWQFLPINLIRNQII